MRTISHIEAEFVIDCRKLDLLCYMLHDQYRDSGFTNKLVQNSERLVLEWIEPIYEDVNNFRYMWYKHAQIYIGNIKQTIDNLYIFNDMVPDIGEEIVCLCDKLAKRCQEIYNNNLMELEN